MQSPHTRQHAFTLIELLVVISIISLMIAILLPALAGARQAAQAAGCMSNQRQIGQLIAVYANENRQWMPPSVQWRLVPYVNWVDRLDTYVSIGKAGTIYTCPSDDNPYNNWLSYGYNYKYGSVRNDWTVAKAFTGLTSYHANYAMRQIDMFYKPSLASMLLDLHNTSEVPNPTGYVYESYVWDTPNLHPELRHQNRYANCLWVDGHVTNVTHDALLVWRQEFEWGSWKSYPGIDAP